MLVSAVDGQGGIWASWLVPGLDDPFAIFTRSLVRHSLPSNCPPYDRVISASDEGFEHGVGSILKRKQLWRSGHRGREMVAPQSLTGDVDGPMPILAGGTGQRTSCQGAI